MWDLHIPGFIYRTLITLEKQCGYGQGQEEEIKDQVFTPAHFLQDTAAGAGDAAKDIKDHQADIEGKLKKEE